MILATVASPSNALPRLKLAQNHRESAPAQDDFELSGGLPPVGNGLAVGMRFERSVFPEAENRDDWVKIPATFAGTWDPDNEAHTGTLQDLADNHLHKPKLPKVHGLGRSSGSDGSPLDGLDFANLDSYGGRGLDGFFGCQKDRTGNIWERSYIVHQKDFDEYGYHTRDAWEILSVSEERVVLRNRAIHVKVDEGGIISSVGQMERIYTYVPAGEGERKLLASMRSFSAKGMPLSTTHLCRSEHMISDFHPINDFEDECLASLFTSYLRKRGLSRLIPTAKGG